MSLTGLPAAKQLSPAAPFSTLRRSFSTFSKRSTPGYPEAKEMNGFPVDLVKAPKKPLPARTDDTLNGRTV